MNVIMLSDFLQALDFFYQKNRTFELVITALMCDQRNVNIYQLISIM